MRRSKYTNPSGNPLLSPDVLGSEIFRYGLDVIIHFNCRDINRVGMESRVLQLARMGLKGDIRLIESQFGGYSAA